MRFIWRPSGQFQRINERDLINVVAENSRPLNNTPLFINGSMDSPLDFFYDRQQRHTPERNFSELETDKNKTRDKENDPIELFGSLRSWINVRNSR